MAMDGLKKRNVVPVRTRHTEDEVFEEADFDADSDGEDATGEDGSDLEAMGETDAESDDESSAAMDIIGGEPDMSTVSFGALQHAQESLPRKRKRDSDTNAEHEEKLDALRSRLRQIKASKQRHDSGPTKTFAKPTLATDAEDMDADSDSAPSEVGAAKSRTSKHAPRSQSSRYQVTRRRTVIEVPKRITRDPRFDALPNPSAPTGPTSNKAYAFLRDYQKSEIAELKSALKKAKTEDDQITLRRKLVAMENRIKAEDAKEREQEVLRQHRREERGKVEEGKKPFYLKQKEVKERALVEKFKGMKGKERQRLVERRRLKESQREKRRMPEGRRG